MGACHIQTHAAWGWAGELKVGVTQQRLEFIDSRALRRINSGSHSEVPKGAPVVLQKTSDLLKEKKRSFITKMYVMHQK